MNVTTTRQGDVVVLQVSEPRLTYPILADFATAATELIAAGEKKILVDLSPHNVTGKDAQEALDRAWITVNKNTVPFETKSPMVTSGIRIGTPAVTTRGMGEPEMERIAALMDRVLASPGAAPVEAAVRGEVQELTSRFPLYPDRLT